MSVYANKAEASINATRASAQSAVLCVRTQAEEHVEAQDNAALQRLRKWSPDKSTFVRKDSGLQSEHAKEIDKNK